MATKKFDKKLYDKADPLAKGAMVKWLQKNNYEFINPKETYGVDITCSKDGVPYFFETEIKYGWKDVWPDRWLEIRIPYRKNEIIKKWMRDGSKGTLTFVIFRPDCKQSWFMGGLIVWQSDVKVVRHPYNKGYGASVKTGVQEAMAETIVTIDADGNFDSTANCDDETVATDKQYVLEILGTTGASDTITVIGAEVTITRILKA